jgi:hypothetical protein
MLRHIAVAALAFFFATGIPLAQEEKTEKQEKAEKKEKKIINGEVKNVTKDSLIVVKGDREWAFVVNKKTRVLDKGETDKRKESKQEDEPTEPRLITEIVKEKQSVEVTYREKKGKLHAGKVRVKS